MRFTLIKNIKKDKSLKPMLNGLFIFMLLFLVADILVKESGFGVSSNQVNITLFGDEENYIDPLSKSLFLEHIHTETFFMMMLLLTLCAVFNRLHQEKRYALLYTNIVMLSALLSILSLGLSYFYSELFISVYIFSFFLWHGFAIFILSSSLWRLNYAKKL